MASDDKRIKWSENLKTQLMREKYAHFLDKNIRRSLYRPFTKQFIYFDPILIDRRLLQPFFLPTEKAEIENIMICVAGIGDRKGFGCLAANTIPNFDLAFEKAQCSPYYTYAEDGSNRRENITDWSLVQFQAAYGKQVVKLDIFHYVYGILHHPQYRERYAENLKRELPRIPLLREREAFDLCTCIASNL
jgi:predicted helicase